MRLGPLLSAWSWPELKHHPWRSFTALLAVALGVALAFSVHLINASALSEFSSAVQSVSGQPDFGLRAQSGGFDEQLYERVVMNPSVEAASPVVEIETRATGADGQSFALRLVGVDSLAAAAITPALLPQLGEGASRMAALDPGTVFLNDAARAKLDAGANLQSLDVQNGSDSVRLAVGGRVSAGGAPLAVIDIAGAQSRFGWLGRLSRIDVKLKPGASREAVVRELALPAGVQAVTPQEGAERVSNLSRAYRVNLTVLSLVALFTGAFLVFSILSLSVAKRQPQMALLGVLGLSSRQRLQLVLAESALLGVIGSIAGLALGTALAAAALKILSGDLGGGYFPGVAPRLQFGPGAALVYGALGTAASVVGGWFPARSAARLAPAQALKGLGSMDARTRHAWVGPGLIALGIALSFAPPIAELPLAAYIAVACLLMGGIACVPAGVALLLGATRPPSHALALLAVQRARHQRQTAAVAVAGVVASLALSVALTVMVGSFRASVDQWLGVVLPADLYVRGGGAAADTALDPSFIASASTLPGIARAETLHVVSLTLDPRRPTVSLIARPIADPTKALPLVGALAAAPEEPGVTSAYVSEAMVNLYGARPGTTLTLPIGQAASGTTVFVRGVWRDYARQFGAVALDTADFRRLTGDDRVNDLALWLAPGSSSASIQARVRQLADRSPQASAIDITSAESIRDTSLHIFDRSFAVTSYLQVLAIGLGLFGIAASFSAQVLARRKEFGLLSHLGLTRSQLLCVVAAEGAVWTGAGAIVGLGLGLAVSVVLVKVVNPQSFNWTMDLLLPWVRLAVLCVGVVLAGTLTAWFAGRAAGGRDAALAVKEDW